MSYLKNSFNGGEVGHGLRYRADLNKHHSSEEILENFLVLPQGGCENRPGMLYLKDVKHGVGTAPAAARLIPFQFSNTEKFVLEFGDGYIRVHDGATQLAEVVSPYQAAKLWQISCTQKNDILFLAHPDYAPRMLKRYGNTNWALETFSPQGGPWLDPESGNVKIKASATTGTGITLTADHDFFSSDMVGARIRLMHTRNSNGFNYTFTAAADIRSTHRLYVQGNWKLITSGTWIGILHLIRSLDNGASWSYFRTYDVNANDNVDDGGYEDESGAIYSLELVDWGSAPAGSLYECHATLTNDSYTHQGSALITAINSATTATANVEFAFYNTNWSDDWSLDAWNEHQGYPALVGFYSGDRLAFASTRREPQTLYFSAVGDYIDFTPGTLPEQAITLTLNTGRYNAIRWMCELGEKLYCGCANGIIRIMSSESDKPLEPGKCRAVPSGVTGAAELPAAAAGEAILFLRRGGRALMEFAYQYSDDVYRTPDMNVLAPDILESGVKELHLRQSPYPMALCVLNSGECACFTYNRIEEVMAWSRIVAGGSGKIESCCVLDTDVKDDELYFVVRRGNSRTIEKLALRDDSSAGAGVWLDKAVVKTADPAAAAWDIDELAGETVTVCADGVVIPGVEVGADGSFVLPFAAKRIVAGHQYSAVMRTLPLELAQGAQGTMGEVKKCVEMVLKFRNTYGGQVELLSGGKRRQLAVRHAGGNLDAPVDEVTPELAVTLYSNARREQQIEVRQDLPLPMTILAIVGETE